MSSRPPAAVAERQVGRQLFVLAQLITIAHVTLRAKNETIELGLGVCPQRGELQSPGTDLGPQSSAERRRIEGVFFGITVRLVGLGNAVG